jgi:predicted transcriptional regulator
MAYPPNSDDLTDAKTTIVNILKMEGYKLDSGSLFLAFKDAGGEMSQFAPSLEELQEENIIKSDSEGNIMTVEDYEREKSQNQDEENAEKKEESELIDEKLENNEEGEISTNGEVEEMLKKKEETDAWLIEKAKNGSKTNEKLSLELAEVKKRVEKLERILEKINEALN